MNKLLFFIIILSIGFSNLAVAQTDNNKPTAKLVLNKNSKHYTKSKAKDTVYVYNSQYKDGHNKNKYDKSKVKYYKSKDKTKGDNKTESHTTSYKKTFLNSNSTKKKYILIMNETDSLKVKKKDSKNID